MNTISHYSNRVSTLVIQVILIPLVCSHKIDKDSADFDFEKYSNEFQQRLVNEKRIGGSQKTTLNKILDMLNLSSYFSYLDQHALEIICLITFISWLLIFLIGSKINKNMANQWLEQVNEVLASNFARIGQSQQINSKEDVHFDEYSRNEFSILASGRENMKYSMITVQLRSRQDMFQLFNSCVCPRWYKMKDIVWVEIPIERPDKTFHSELLVIQKRQIKETFENMPHLQKIMFNLIPSIQAWNNQELPIQIFGENQESVDALTGDNRVVDFFINNKHTIMGIHITDQNLYSKNDLVMKLQFKLDMHEITKWQKIMKDVLYLADYVSKIKISQKTQDEVLKNRKKQLKAPPQVKKTKSTQIKKAQ